MRTLQQHLGDCDIRHGVEKNTGVKHVSHQNTCQDDKKGEREEKYMEKNDGEKQKEKETTKNASRREYYRAYE